MFSSLITLEQVAENRFEAPASPDKGPRVFGGQFLAQCVTAAQATAEPDRQVHSLHGYFLRPGDVDLPVQLTVEIVRDGRSFSSRQVTASQGGRELFRMQASLQVPVHTPVYAGAEMPEVPPPEQISLTYDGFTLQQTGELELPGAMRPVDIRYVNPPTVRGEPVTEAQLMWMKIRGVLPHDRTTHLAGLAYLSDSTIVDHVMLPHGKRWQDKDFEGASLDHSMWFHHDARADAWLLFVQSVDFTGAGGGLARGQFFDRAGNMVATCAQEGLMRWASD